MTDKDYTEIILLVDKSGSMERIKRDTEGGINTFIEEQRKVPGKCKVTLVTFSGNHNMVYSAVDISDVPRFELSPTGSTALLDAIGHTINSVGERLSALKEEERPGKIFFVISTDGEENASKEFTRAHIFDKIKHQTDQYKWEFVFLGANQDAIQVGHSIGINAQRAVTYSANAVGTKSLYRGLSNAMAFSRVSGQAMSYNQAAYNQAVDSVLQQDSTSNSNP